MSCICYTSDQWIISMSFICYTSDQWIIAMSFICYTSDQWIIIIYELYMFFVAKHKTICWRLISVLQLIWLDFLLQIINRIRSTRDGITLTGTRKIFFLFLFVKNAHIFTVPTLYSLYKALLTKTEVHVNIFFLLLFISCIKCCLYFSFLSHDLL